MKLIQILDELKLDLQKKGYYDNMSIIEENLMDTHVMLAELLNPNNAYEYRQSNISNMYLFTDMYDNTFFVRLAFQPIGDGYFEVKSGWLDENQKAQYKKLPVNSSGQDWDTRSDTVAKIYRDEIVPFFEKQTTIDTMVFKPIDLQRYYFSLRMINKFPVDNYTVIENKPTKISIVKNT